MKGIAVFAVAVLVLFAASTPVWSQCGLCGDAAGNGDVGASDISALIEYLYMGGTLTCPYYSDVDGYPGITHNDIMVLTAHKFITFQPITCPPTAGAEPPQSNDSIWFQYIWIPVDASTDKWQVPVWGKEVSNVAGFSIPIEFSLPGYTIELDSISAQYSRYATVASFWTTPTAGPLCTPTAPLPPTRD